MGRTRVKSRKANTSSNSTEKEEPSIENLLKKAQSLVTQCDYDLAQKFALRILERCPTHVEGKELLGVIQLERGDLEDAEQTFKSLLSPAQDAPNPPPPSAHLYLAQLSEDDPQLALQHYEAAVNLLYGQLKGKERAEPNDEGESETDIRQNIVRVLVAMVEIWMSPTYDLCFNPEAESMCERLLGNAFDVDPGNVEALICLSSFKLSQGKSDEAREAATKAWTLWKDEDEENSSKIPPISSRIELVKRFLELSEYAPALAVLQGIMASDDQNVEAWYLEGWCFFLMAEEAKETGSKVEDLSWEELSKDALECLDTSVTFHTSQEHPDAGLLEHAKELIAQLEAVGIKSTPNDAEEDASWEDVEDSDDAEDVDMD